MGDLRRALRGDEMAVAEVHVASWRVAYRTIVPASYLDALSASDRAARYDFAGRLAESPTTWLALEGSTVTGFISLSRARGRRDADLGEIQALYVDPSCWRSGTGTALMALGESELVKNGCRGAILWVLEDNTIGRNFYHRAGWTPTGERSTITINEVEIPELAYAKSFSAPEI
jgi:ribosomal protein S18 acetylase RimI-like enzyme